jgi:PAS domain-containing protein
LYVYIHIANPTRKTLDLLHIHPVPAKKPSFSSVQHIPYDSSFPIVQVYKQHNPIIIENLQTAPSLGIIDSSNALVMSGGHGYACVPLWFGDTFEGTLTAVFKECISEDGPEVQALVGSGMYIAAALAHARLHRTIENERRRLRAVLDQLPEGILITEASNGCISYANAAAANILGIPVTSLTGIPLNRHPQILTLIHDALPVPQAGLPTTGTSNYTQAAYKENIATRINNHPIFPWHFAVIRALGGETISSQEAMVVRPDGNKVITLSSSAPLRIEGGDITGAVIVFQDVTAQKSIEPLLSLMNRAKVLPA